jgi:DNA-binding NarL/FixJ family response regulator
VIIVEEHPAFGTELYQASSNQNGLRLLDYVPSEDTIQNTASIALTRREIQILNYIADGNANKQIAHILQAGEQTIKNHVSNILRKLNANDRAHAVAIAIGKGWISAK